MADACIQDLVCRNRNVALRLKIGGLVAILAASTLGVVVPILAKGFTRSKLFFMGKCFAAGVILATGFVHILPNAYDSFANPCLAKHPWSDFPFSGFIAMLGALGTLVVDSAATSFYQRQASAKKSEKASDIEGAKSEKINETGDIESAVPVPTQHHDIHIHDHDHDSHSHGHHHGGAGASMELSLRSRVIAQVLELGIITHSVIIGISMGASESPCTIRPLVAALSFHQFFEGLALGGCIVMGGFSRLTTLSMALCFSLTTPIGVAIGIGISSSYNENSSKALIIEGIFDSLSAGILVYMALVDLIAAEFLTGEFVQKISRQVLGYASLLTGAFAMALLAIWA